MAAGRVSFRSLLAAPLVRQRDRPLPHRRAPRLPARRARLEALNRRAGWIDPPVSTDHPPFAPKSSTGVLFSA